MPLFSYVIRDKFKKVSKGTTQARSEEDLRKHFRRQGYLVFSINEIDSANDSKENENFREGFKIGTLLFILLLISGGYLVIKSITQSSHGLKEKESPVIKVETTPKEISRIIIEEIIYKPEQDIVSDKVMPDPEQKEGVVKIALKREAEKIPVDRKTSPHYAKAQTYYYSALEYKMNSPKKSNSYFRKAIKYAQKALMAREGNEEEIKAFIRNCRRNLRE